jgi:hypothetical protein
MSDEAIAAARAHLNGHALPEQVDWAELFARDRSRDDWLVTDLWPRGRQISLTAPRKERKSLLMLYLAACLAIGRDPWTRRPVDPLSVCYLDFEMTEDDLLERIEDMEFDAAELDGLHYFLRPDMPMLDQPEGGKMLLEVIDAHHAEAVIIDTFSRVISTRDYTGHEVREFYRWSAQHVKARGVSLARLDHTGHSVTDRASGSSAKGADVDVGWVIHRGDEQSMMLEHHGLSRLGWVADHLGLTIHDDPLRFGRVAKMWIAGVTECVEEINKLHLPVDVSANAAFMALKDAKQGRRRAVVLQAVAYRKESGTTSGTTPSTSGTRNPGTTTPESGDNQGGYHPGYHRVPPPQADGYCGVPQRGTTVPGPDLPVDNPPQEPIF